MTTDKAKSIRDYRGRFKKKRYASPSQAREIFDRMYEREERAREAAREAYLRTPEGERERQEFNRRTLERLRKNPRRRITRKDARDILSEMKKPGADFHSLSSHDVSVLLDHAKHYHYRAPKNASGSKARYFYAYLERVAKNPRERRFDVVFQPYSLERGSVGKASGPEQIHSRHGSKKAAERSLAGFISTRGAKRGKYLAPGFYVIRDNRTGETFSLTASRARNNPRKMKVTVVKRNARPMPIAMAASRAWIIQAKQDDGPLYYFTGSSLDTNRRHAQTYANKDHAASDAHAIKNRLPREIEWIKVTRA